MMAHRTRALGAFVCLVAGTGLALAQEAGSDDAPVSPPTLESLQRQIDDLIAKQAKTPTIGSSRSTMKLFGRIHVDAWAFDVEEDATVDPRNNIEFRRARLGVSGKMEDDMEYKIELEFGQPVKLAFKDLFFGFNNLSGGQKVLIGNQKRPYGLDHLNSSRFNVFTERPFIVEALNQDARRLGIQAYGVSDDQSWNWRYGGFNMTDWANLGSYVSDRFQPEFAGRIANTAMWERNGERYAHWAVSGSFAFPDGDAVAGNASNEGRFRTRPEARTLTRWIDTGRIAGIDSYQLAGVEGVWNEGPTQVVAEFMNSWVTRDTGSAVQFPGGYIQAAHFLTGEHMPWDRKSGTLGRPKPSNNFASGTGWGAWQVAARYSFADFSSDDIRGGDGNSITLGLNWYWNANASVQLNYIRGEISDRGTAPGGGSFNVGDYEVIGMRMRFDF